MNIYIYSIRIIFQPVMLVEFGVILLICRNLIGSNLPFWGPRYFPRDVFTHRSVYFTMSPVFLLMDVEGFWWMSKAVDGSEIHARTWGWYFIPLFVGFYTSQMVSRISSINNTSTNPFFVFFGGSGRSGSVSPPFASNKNFRKSIKPQQRNGLPPEKTCGCFQK